MRRFKSTMIMLVFALAGRSALAQPPGSPPGPPIEEIAAELGLDATQKDAIEAIFEEHHARMAEERRLLEASGQRPTREEMHASHEQARQDLEARLSTVLTLEQREQFHTLMEERRPRRGAEPPASRGTPAEASAQ